jgi:site-specific DNA recombinase
MNKRVAIYLRESRDDNQENYETIETQKDLLLSFIKKNSLGELNGIYIDDNVSGSTFDRTGLMQFQNDLENGKIDILVLKDLSRLGRNNAKTLLFLDYLEEHNIRVITADGRFDSIKDNEMVGIDTWFNERVLKDISRKIRANLRVKIEKGEYIGTAPFGYRKSNIYKNKLEIFEEEASIVKEIYKLYVEDGKGYAQIAKDFNNREITFPSFENIVARGMGWSPVAIMRILSNEVYIGNTIQGVSQKMNYKSKKTIRLPQPNWIITENTHDSIISKEQFNKVQKIREMKKSGRILEKNINHSLSGIIFCGNCGSHMFARKRPNRPLGYVCSNYIKNGKFNCKSHFVDENSIIDIIYNKLNEEFSNTINIEYINKRVESDIIKVNDLKDDRNKLSRQIESKLRQQEILYMDRLDDRISTQLFEKMNIQIVKTLEKLKCEFDNILKLSENHEQIITTEFACSMFTKNSIDREIIRCVVNKIIVYDQDELNIAIKENHEIEERCLFHDPKNSGFVIIKFT